MKEKAFAMMFASGLAAALAMGSAKADTPDMPIETFEGAAASNGAYPVGAIPGAGIEALSGNNWIVPSDEHGHFLTLGSGSYGAYDAASNIGSSSAQSVASFDLLAGVTYTVSYDYSRGFGAGGNGPFETHLTVAFGSSHSVTYDDVAGFYYGTDWQAGSLSFTPSSDELGAHIVFTAYGPAGYSSMSIDNISMVGVAAPVPEPAGSALLLAGLGALVVLAKKRSAIRQP